MTTTNELTTISIAMDGVWAGSGKLVDGIIEDCGAQFCDDQDESENVYELIEEAIAEGKDSLKVELSKRDDAVEITWTIAEPLTVQAEKSPSWFISISTDPTAWGDTTSDPDFNVDDEVSKIRDAAESQGIEVLTDESPRAVYSADGTEKDPIDWFTTWCREGYQWSDSQWREWFATFSK